MDEILQDIEKCNDFGPEILSNVAESFIKTAVRPLTKESRAGLKEKMKTPVNCKQFVTPKVNPEIWRLLPPHGKLADVKHQQIQQTLSIGLSTFSVVANLVVSNKDKIPKEVVSSILRNAMDGANIMGDQFQGITMNRRMEIKKYLNPEYAGICSAQINSSEFLFGNDLTETLKASKATSSLLKSTSIKGNYRHQPYASSGPRFTPRGNSLNGNRPFFSQTQRNGQFRFRQQTPFRPMRYQQSTFNQKRFQK